MKSLTIFVAALSVLLIANSSEAKSSLKFENARIFQPLKGSNATAGYADIKNESDKEIEITLKLVEKFKAAETHETSEVDGKMSMKKVDSFKVPAKGTLELKPGGRHLMLFDPIEVIKENSSLKVVFMINGKEESFKFKVISRQEKSEDHSHH